MLPGRSRKDDNQLAKCMNILQTTARLFRWKRQGLAITGLAALVAMAAAFFVLSSPGGDESVQGLIFEIPAGSSEHVEVPTIDSAIEIPTEIVFEAEDMASLSIVNNDTIAHRAGPWVVGPGQSYTLRLENPGEYRFDCSVDPSESVVITVKEP